MIMRKPKIVHHYEVTVFNQSNGDIEAYRSDISEQELWELQDYFEDEPFCQVVIDREWDEEE